MIVGAVACKMLGISESIAEPTVYHLLQVDPRTVTIQSVSEALRQRKLLLRRGIPGPQFIPVVSMIEKQLDEAAAILIDPQRRREYDQSLLVKAQPPAQQAKTISHRELVLECRRIVKSMLNTDGTLEDARRGQLAQQLRELDLNDTQLQSILDGIPRPAAILTEPTWEGMQFFTAAVDMEIERGGMLGEANERKLLTMAGKLAISTEIAQRHIDEQLHAKGARRGTAAAPGSGQDLFVQQVRAMHPDGNISPESRNRLLALGASQGLSPGVAAAAINECLSPPAWATQAPAVTPVHVAAPAEASTSVDPMPPSSTSPGPAPLPMPPAPAATISPESMRRIYIGAGMGVVAILIAVLLYFVVAGDNGKKKPGPTKPDQGTLNLPDLKLPEPTTVPKTQPTTPKRDLADWLLDKADAPDQVRKIAAAADGTELLEALAKAAGRIKAPPTPQTSSARKLFAGLCRAPPPKAAVQNATIAALLESFRRATRDSAQCRGAQAQADLLASVLFLKQPGPPIADRLSADRFLQQCESAWQESLKQSPDDALNDTRRLTAAVADGGDLGLYAARSDNKQFSSVTRVLADVAADPKRRGARAAINQLITAATGQGRFPNTAKKPAQLALCDVLRRTSDVGVADTARAALASARSLDASDPVRTAVLATADQRRALAKRIEDLIQGGTAATRPVAPPPHVATVPFDAALTEFAKRLRKSYSTTGATQELLADVATTALACADLSDRATLRTGHLTTQRDSVTRAGPSRIAELTAGITLDLTGAAAPIAGPAASSAGPAKEAVLKQLAKDICKPNSGIRSLAIEKLRGMDTPEAADILLKRLLYLSSRTAGDADIVICRILRALGDMSDPGIPMRLVTILERCRSKRATVKLVEVLAAGTGATSRTSPYRGTRASGRLPYNYTTTQRKACVRWWKSQAGMLRWGGGAAASTTPKPAAKAPPAWKPDETSLKLLVACGRFEQLAAKQLKTFKWNAPPTPAPPPPPGTIGATPPDVALSKITPDLLDALENQITHLTRLAREHKRHKSYAIEADMVSKVAKGRTSACQTDLQKAAVYLGAVGEIIEILVREADEGGSHAAARKAIVEHRKTEVAKITNVIQEMRAHSFHNLAMWELLVQISGP